MANASNIQHETQALEQKLSKWAMQCSEEQNLDLSYHPSCGLAFKHHPYHEDSDARFNTYLSAYNSMYTIHANAPANPPIDNTPAT